LLGWRGADFISPVQSSRPHRPLAYARGSDWSDAVRNSSHAREQAVDAPQLDRERIIENRFAPIPTRLAAPGGAATGALICMPLDHPCAWR
jgi:hypothetical protein